MLDEIELFVEAGVTPWRALRAATSGAAEFVGQSDTWGAVAVGRRADLLLLHGDPTADVKNLAARAGVMTRGRWFPAAELEAELAKAVEYNTGKRSRLAEEPAIPVDGTREQSARFVMHRGGEYAGEQRLVIDRRAGGRASSPPSSWRWTGPSGSRSRPATGPARVVVGSKLEARPAILRLLRRPDRKEAPGQRFFSVAFTARNQTVKGEIILDRDGHLIQESYPDSTIRRAE